MTVSVTGAGTGSVLVRGEAAERGAAVCARLQVCTDPPIRRLYLVFVCDAWLSTGRKSAQFTISMCTVEV